MKRRAGASFGAATSNGSRPRGRLARVRRAVRRRRRRVWSAAGLVAVVVVFALGFVAFEGIQAGLAANRGKAALLNAERHARGGDVEAARRQLEAGERAFGDMGAQIDDLGPLLPVARRIPVVGSQVVGTETLAETGVLLSRAGGHLVDAAARILDGNDQRRLGGDLVEPLGQIRTAVQASAPALDQAAAKVASLSGEWLIGPLGDAYETLAVRVPELRDQVGRTDRGLGALATFVGGSRPRRYLFLSQNPDEVRPTGGFIGTYGVLTADAGQLALQRYEPIQSWTGPRPGAVVPGEEAGSPFRFASPPIPQTLGNVNNTPDWPSAAALAADLWVRGGEEPVHGVLSVVPSFLARLLSVLGPVEVPEYGERVTSANLAERFEFYTERYEEEPSAGVERKQFVVALAEVVIDRLLEAPSSRWQKLAGVVGEGFERSEAMAWSTDDDVAGVLAERGWDRALPEVAGDFFYNGEFSYLAKNGTSLRRTFDHHVELRRDGSARVTTSMRIANTEEPGSLNSSSLSYVTLYGPRGGELAPESDPPLSAEPSLAGHPAAGWLLAAPPLGETTVTVAWDVPTLAPRQPDGTRSYSLRWLHLPGHAKDQVNLSFRLPAGWEWDGAAPPSSFRLDRDFTGTWSLDEGGAG